MIDGKKVIVVLPAYNAEKTLARTVTDVRTGFVDEFLVVDDASSDNTSQLAKKLNLNLIRHEANRGYGANQKTCYRYALDRGADIIVMLHADYQYEPRLVPAMSEMVASGVYDVVLGSRILGLGALRGGMPFYKYVFNRMLTFTENILINQKLSEFHTGFRAYSRQALEAVDWQKNSDDFIFDNEILAQFHMAGLNFGEISCPTKYHSDASSINFSRSVKYGLGVLAVAMKFRLQAWGLANFKLFSDGVP